MKLALYQVDAFANKVFEGNPAAICPLDEWLSGDVMQSIALENNLSETAFFVKTNDGYHIRWFTPASEVDLCGHATLASAYVIFNLLGYKDKEISFDSKSGILKVAQNDEWLEMDFPSQAPVECDIPESIIKAFSVEPIECLKAEDYIVVFDNEETILNEEPELSELAKLDLRGVTITAASNEYDFVNRFFGPKVGIDEDPVTGSAFTQLVPYWSDKLNKEELSVKQVSKRGGEARCTLSGDRVKISGKVALYMMGTIDID